MQVQTRQELELARKIIEIKELIHQANEIASENGIYLNILEEVFSQEKINNSASSDRSWRSSARNC